MQLIPIFLSAAVSLLGFYTELSNVESLVFLRKTEADRKYIPDISSTLYRLKTISNRIPPQVILHATYKTTKPWPLKRDNILDQYD